MLPAWTGPRADRLFVGIASAAKRFTCAWMTTDSPVRRARTLPQTAQGYAGLQEHLAATGHAPSAMLIVMEATGTYWVTLAVTLVQAGFAVSVVNTTQARAFANAVLRRAKTDPIAAQTRALLAARLQPPRWTPPPASSTDLEPRLSQRDARVTVRTELQHHLHAHMQHPVVVPTVRARLAHLIAQLSEEIVAIEQEIAEVLRQDAAWAAAAARWQTMTGIGMRTAAWILVTTVNVTRCRTAEEATSYAGLAPNPHQSGTSTQRVAGGRGRIGRTGNARLRRVVYLATVRAARHNPSIKVFYDRFRAAGKPGYPLGAVARGAAAGTLWVKVLQIAWAVVTKARDVDPAYAAQTEPAA